MPGLKACGRCGALLQLGALAISVHPPRASAWVKWWRRRSVRARLAVQNAARAVGAVLVDRDVYDGPIGPVMRRTIVPGWPQFYQGRRLRGSCFLGIYASLAASALATLGTEIGSVCLGLAIATHASSALDVVLPATRESEGRLVRILAMLGLVGLIAYGIPFYAISGFAVPRRIAIATGPLDAGDVVLLSPGIYRLRSPQPGDTVLYELPALQVPARRQTHATFEFRGQRIDRILAGPGEHLQFDDGNWFIDGRPSSQVPLHTRRLPRKLDIRVPPDCYFILPTTALMDGMDLERLDWARASLVRTERILGRVWIRHWPWRRFALL